MPVIAPEDMKTSERLPGWHGRYWRSESMSFAHYEIAAGASIHEQGPGAVAIVPPNALHSVRALSEATALIADHPVRHEFP